MYEVTPRWPCGVWGTGQRSFDLLALDNCGKVVVGGRPVSKLTHSVSTGSESQLSEDEDRGASVRWLDCCRSSMFKQDSR